MEDSTTIKCTDYCGFEVSGTQLFCQQTYQNHKHQEEGDEDNPRHWTGHVFSIPGIVIALIVCSAVVAVITGDTSMF